KAATTVAEGQGWKLELFSTGKNLVVPPSVHPDTGKAYRWIRGEIDAVPDALLETEGYIARGNSEQAQREASTHSSSLGIPEGRRASTLARWARGFQGGGYSDDQVRQFIPTATSIFDLSAATQYAAPVDPTHHQEAAHVTCLSDRRRRLCYSHV